MKPNQLALAALRAKSNADPAGHLATAGAYEGEMPSLAGATEWLNSPPLTPAELRGRVVAFQFWTYTCINWLRTLPYVRAWARKYREHGLVVVGVHTPEFSFEKDVTNVRRAIADRDIGYPVAVDSDYAIWEAFANNYWPALYLVDADGHIRYHHYGEGEYSHTEMVIQRLLADGGVTGLGRDLVPASGDGAEAAADWADLWTPETYVGLLRTGNFASPQGPVLNQPRDYTLPDRLELNHWAPSGNWTLGAEGAVLNEAGGRIAYRFHARDLHLVMGALSGADVRFRVTIDGEPAGSAHGVDVDKEGLGTASQRRLYQLVRQPLPIADREFQIEFLDAGAAVYAFTFG